MSRCGYGATFSDGDGVYLRRFRGRAGGFYLDGTTKTAQAFVIGEESGTWGKAQGLPTVASLNTGGSADLAAISCVSPGNCSVAGSYEETGDLSDNAGSCRPARSKLKTGTYSLAAHYGPTQIYLSSLSPAKKLQVKK